MSGPADPARPAPTALAGLLARRERWGLTGRGWLALVVATCGIAVGAFFGIHPFLAVTAPSRTTVAVVEGWIPAYGLREAIAAIRQRGYTQVLTSGTLTHEDSGDRVGSTYADWGAQRLQRYGLRDVPVTAVPCYVERRDRTYSSALAVRHWLEENHSEITAVDVITLGAHARRSRLLFEKALGGRYQVGIISVENIEYDPRHWWTSSEGVREIIGEGIAYIYARFLFWPSLVPAGNRAA